MMLKPAWDGFAAMGTDGLVALSQAGRIESPANRITELFHSNDPASCEAPPVSLSHAVEKLSARIQGRAKLQTMKKPANHEKGKQVKELHEPSLENGHSKRSSRRERRMTLEQDIEKLRKKLRFEENVHRALERAFTRPLGALPRLPPYLPPQTLELLAEVAVLEEEVVRLEEQIVHLRQGLYQEAAYISSSRKQIEPAESAQSCKAKKPELLRSPSGGRRSVQEGQQGKRDFVVGGLLPSINESSPERTTQDGGLHRRQASLGSVSETKGLHLLTQTINEKHPPYKGLAEATESLSGPQKSPGPSEFCHGKENQLQIIPKNAVSFSQISKSRPVAKIRSTKDRRAVKMQRPTPNVQTQQYNLGPENISSLRALQDGPNIEPNKLSEEMVKCLLSIFLKLTRQSVATEYDTSSVVSHSTLSSVSSRSLGSRSTLSCKTPMDSSEEIDFRDPYGVCVESEFRDVGPYKHLHDIIASSIDLSRIQNSAYLLRRLRILVDKLSSVDLRGLTHQQKLAFWINIYNVCMMHAFLEHGIPDTPQMVVALMHKAILNVGGHLLNALTIEHFILRLPYHSKDAYPKGGKNDKEATMRSVYGLEWPEPLVTFALSCGSRSSPAVRVYTAAEVESELEAAKKEYLQAAVGVTSKRKLLVPKLLDWYLLDFAKDAESLLDWICLQLPSSLRNAMVECLERGRKGLVSQAIEVMPYEFDFRYLLAV